MMGLFGSWNKPFLPPSDLLDLVRDPELTDQLRLAKERGILGVISRETRDIDPSTATIEALETALEECHCWRITYPETDDYHLVEWLEARCKEEIFWRGLAKINGGIDPRRSIRQRDVGKEP
jgi:hypothetical protein